MSEPTRQHLLDAAARVYADSGFRGATTRRIAEEAGVNEVTLFRLFGSKAALIEAAIQAHSSVATPVTLPDTPVDPVAELTAWAEQDHVFMTDCRHLIRTTMAELHERPDCAGPTAKRPVESHAQLTRYVGQLEKQGFVPNGADAAPAATMLLGSLFADAMGRDMMPEMFPPMQQAPATYVRLFLRSLGATLGAALALALLLALPGDLSAQRQDPTSSGAPSGAPSGTLSLADALRIAERRSATVRIAEAGAARARGQQRQADSQRLPQINGGASYQRAIQSQFEEITKRFPSADTSAAAGGGLANSPIAKIFAAPSTAVLSLSATQNLWTAGRVGAARAGAGAARDAADIAVAAARAQAMLDVAQAYFDAVASEQLQGIADSTLVLTERALSHVELARQVGTASEFDLLRARVARDNQRPLVIQAHGHRTTALLRLKQLLNLPLGAPLTLTTPIRDDATVIAEATAPIRLADDRTITPDTSVSARSSVRQVEAQVRAQEYALRAARLSRFPVVQLSSTYQRFAYPPDGDFLPSALDLYFPNWTVSLGLSFPVFSGGRIAGERMVAEANLLEARETLERTRDGAELDAILAVSGLEQAQAAYLASVGTDAQAEQAYRIAEVRFREGISTPVELTESRVQLEQARLQRVTTARDLEMAKLRLALLKDLPLTAGGAR